MTLKWLERPQPPAKRLGWCNSAGVPSYPIRRQTAQPSSATALMCFFSLRVVIAFSNKVQASRHMRPSTSAIPTLAFAPSGCVSRNRTLPFAGTFLLVALSLFPLGKAATVLEVVAGLASPLRCAIAVLTFNQGGVQAADLTGFLLLSHSILF